MGARQRTAWTEDMVLEAIRKRQTDGLPVNYQAVVRDHEALTGAARRLFGSWDAALEAAGLDPTVIKRQARAHTKPHGYWTQERVIQLIQQAAREHRDLSVHRMEKVDGSLVASARNLFGGWDEALIAAGYSPDLVRRRVGDWDDGEILDRIRRLAQEGADVSDQTASAWDHTFYVAACTRFKSWQKALDAAGVPEGRRNAQWSRNRVLQAIRAGQRDETVRRAALRYFTTWQEAVRTAGVPDERAQRVGNRIRERRKALGISTVELGRRVGISHVYVSQLELGQVPNPRVSLALRIAQALECRVEDLFEANG